MAVIENFYYIEGWTSAQDIIKGIVKEITTNAGVYNWTLISPTTVDEITDYGLIKATTSYTEEFYVRFERPTSEVNNRNHFYMTIGKDIYETTKTVNINGTPTEIQVQDLVESTCSLPTRLSWYKNLHDNVGMWLPIQYWLNVTKDAVNIILRGDPSADIYPYDNYLTSYAYIGTVKPMEDDSFPDDKYNFGITTSSDIAPSFSEKFGSRTATGTTDVCMIANKVGMPMQPHYGGFYTTHSFMDKCNTEGSRWNNTKHQFSDITLVHPIDMERGKMHNVLIGDASSIYDMDKLIYKKGTDEEENYKKFKITAPYNFLNNSANGLYCLAIRCYQATE